MKHEKQVRQKRRMRKTRVRAVITGNALRPRLTVFRSNKAIYAQLIDDEKGKTVVAASQSELGKSVQGKKKTEIARMVGERIAKKAVEKDITRAVFDRRSYAYHGRVRALAEGARAGGLKV